MTRFDGHIGSLTGEGLLAVFGHPRAHEDDVRRAVLAGLEITREVARLGEQIRHRFGMEIAARAGVHRGLVYLDTAQNDVYGLGANLAARVSGLAPPGTIVISDAVAPLIRNSFELAPCEPAAVKGVTDLIAHHRVLGERAPQATVRTPPLWGATASLVVTAQLGARSSRHLDDSGGGVAWRAGDRQVQRWPPPPPD